MAKRLATVATLVVATYLGMPPRPAVAATVADPAVAYQVSAQHDGSQAQDPLAPPLARIWDVSLNGPASYPLIANGSVFVVTGHAPAADGSTASLYAIDAATGSVTWGPRTVSQSARTAGATYDNGRVFTVSDQTRAFDAATGNQVWGNSYAGTAKPVAQNGLLFLGNQTLHESDGSLAWQNGAVGGDGPAVTGSGVYLSAGCQNTYDLSPVDGHVIWSYPPSQVCTGGTSTTPVLHGGRLWIQGDPYTPAGQSPVILDAANGSVLGHFTADTDEAFTGSIGAFTYGSVIRAEDLNTGAAPWTFTGDCDLFAPPVAANGYLYAGSTTGSLYAINAVTGQVVWSDRLGHPVLPPSFWDANRPLSAMAVGDGLLVVPAEEHLIAYTSGPSTATPAPIASSGPSAITEFSSGKDPEEIVSGPDGNLWLSEGVAGKIARLTTGGTLTEYPVPTVGGNPIGLIAGPDGAIWFAEEYADKLGRLDPANGTITEYPTAWTRLDNFGRPYTPGPYKLTVGADGNIWFTARNSNQVASINPVTKAFTHFDLPGPVGLSGGANPAGIVTGSDHNLWLVQAGMDQVLKVVPGNGAITAYPIPTPAAAPEGIVAGPDGNLWFTETGNPDYQRDTSYGPGSKIGRITPAGAITEYETPTSGSGPYDITTGPDGALWFAEWARNGPNAPDKIGRITTDGAAKEYWLPRMTNLGTRGIVTGPDHNLWFTEGLDVMVGQLKPQGSPCPPPPPSPSTNPAPPLVNAAADAAQSTISATPGAAPMIQDLKSIITVTLKDAAGNPLSGKTVRLSKVSGPGTPDISDPSGTSNSAGVVTFQVDMPSWMQPGTDTFQSVDTSDGVTIAQTAAVTFFVPNYRLYLPALSAGAYGGYVTSAQISNAGTAPGSIYLEYLNDGGGIDLPADGHPSVPNNAVFIARQDRGGGLKPGEAGSGIVYSDQPIAGFVNEFSPGAGDGSSYSAIVPLSGTGTTLYAPTIVNRAYGGYTTGIGLFTNCSYCTAAASITYRGQDGTVIKTQSVDVVGYLGVYSGDPTLGLPTGFIGTATIAVDSQSGGTLSAIVNEVGPNGQFSSYDAIAAGAGTLHAPIALRNAFGGYNTGIAIQNVTGTAGTVSVTYYTTDGGVAATHSLPISAYGYLGIYQGTDIPLPGAYTAMVTGSAGVNMAAIVNEVTPASSGGSQQSTSYNTIAAGSSTVHLPLVESAGPDGWSTGEGIMNTGNTAVTVTLSYYDITTGAPIGQAQTQMLQPNALWSVYQPDAGLPVGSRATATISAAGGSLVVTCNEQGQATFMSYVGQ